jgi:hypothetical protein
MYRVIYRDSRIELVNAEGVEHQGAHYTFHRAVLVIGRPRDVVVRRIVAGDVETVEPCGQPATPRR